MTCNEVQQEISAFMDDALELTQQGGIFLHLGTCPVCRTFFGRLLETRRVLGALPQPEVPARLDGRVLRSAPRRERPRRLAALWGHRLSVPLPSAAILALALLTATVFSLSLLFRQGEVPVACLPAIDVYAQQSTTPSQRQ